MPDRFVESHIRQIPMFQQLSSRQLAPVVNAFQVLRFGKGEAVVVEGNATQGLFMFVEGSGTLTRRQPNGVEQGVGTVRENDVLDRGALFHTGVEEASLRVNEPSTLLFLSRKRMQTVLSHYPEIRATLGFSDVGTTVAPAQPVDMRGFQANRTIENIQREDEDILMVLRRHPWSFIGRSGVAVLIFAAFGAGGLAVMSLSPVLSLLLSFGGLVVAALIVTYFYLEWHNDSIVITDMRVIRIERVIPTFSVNINEIPLDRVQEVNSELPEGDLFARIFNYGDVELKNASDAGDMVLDMVPNPDEVQEAIFSRRAQHSQLADENRRNAIRADIEKYIGLGNPGAISKNDVMPPETTAPQNPVLANAWSLLAPARMKYVNTQGDTVFRKHVTVWLANVAAPLLVLGSAAVVALLSVVRGIGIIGFPISAGLFILGAFWFWWSDWDWRNDMYILSDDRVTLIHRRPLWLQNEIDQVLLNRVDNVVSETSGLVDAIFQRGNVRLSLVGEGLERAKVFYKVHRPHDVQAEISRRQAREKVAEQQREQAQQEEAIRDYLSVYHETVQTQDQATPAYGVPPVPQAPPTPTPDVSPYRTHDQQRPPQVPRRNLPRG